MREEKIIEILVSAHDGETWRAARVAKAVADALSVRASSRE